MINYSSLYYLGDTLSLPHSIRTYFDHGAHEWRYATPKQKLLDIGYMTAMGYDFFQDIQDVLNNHPYISEWDIKYSIALLMAELSGRTPDVLDERYENVPLKKMLGDLHDFITNQYILPYDGSDHYLIDWNSKTTDEDILKANHWNIVADMCHGNEALYSDVNEYIYPGDEAYIRDFNARANDKTRFRLNTIPYPFQGNPLTAKVIILSLNAGYIPRVNHYFAKVLQHYPQLAEGVMCFMRDNLRLHVDKFMPDGQYERHPDYQDAYNMLGDWYWYDILSKWSKEGMPMDYIFTNVALIQSIPYASIEAKDLPKGCTLPSQIFAKKMIRHIANTKDAIFVVPRAVKKWRALLGTTWDTLEQEGRLVVGRNPLNQHLTEKNIGEMEYYKIISHLKNKI